MRCLRSKEGEDPGRLMESRARMGDAESGAIEVQYRQNLTKWPGEKVFRNRKEKGKIE